ncbi:unnamed protein product [Sphenostylis stenocarpa]|uniref:Thaumatin-like protein n=1 Tax=Sphenostylis stenocarpa TaxID=92480 RepID=A0AA86SWJ3_9FABA|nr:unnamed protein product [Sphenostylis stenocarpa]
MGFELAPGGSDSVDVPSPWSGRFWARTGCSKNDGGFTCATGDCGSGQLECNRAGVVVCPHRLAFGFLFIVIRGVYVVSMHVPQAVVQMGYLGKCVHGRRPKPVNLTTKVGIFVPL